MRIALYYPWVYLKSGIERTIMELAQRSRHRWTVFTSHYDAKRTYPELKGMGVVELSRVPVRRAYGAVIKAAATIAATKLDLRWHDAVVVCCDGLGSLITLRNAHRPIACLCFTPLRAVYDEAYRQRHLAKHTEILPLCLFLESAYRRLDRLAWRRYEHVFCISETVKKRVVDGGLYPESGIEVAYPGIDEQKIEPSQPGERYFFLPGRIMWTKNIELGIEAFARFNADAERPFRLVVAGMVDAKSQSYYAHLRELAGDRRDISFVRDPTDAEMRELYRRCYALLLTAFNEDLGLTPLEAMMVGKPVIAVRRGGPTEIVSDGETGLLADCRAEAFCQAMRRLADNPQLAEEMGRAGLERARLFTWERFVGKIDAYFDRLADQKRRGGADACIGPGHPVA